MSLSTVRQIYENMPALLSIPHHMQHKRVEVILLPLDEVDVNVLPIACDEFGWPIGLFDKLTNSWQGEPLTQIMQAFSAFPKDFMPNGRE